MTDTLFKSVKEGVSKSTSTDSLKDELKKISLGLKPNEIKIVNGLIDVVNSFENNKGAIVEIIKSLMIIVETIQGNGLGDVKKEQAKELFTLIVGLLNVSQRDRKLYVSIFDNTVEMVFWGREWAQASGCKWFKCC